MLNLYQLVTGAHGGQALESLAGQFGISRDQADRAVQVLMPALSAAFTAKAAQPGGLGAIAGAMMDDQHRQAYASPGTAQDPTTQRKGSEVVGTIFGSNAMVGQVLAQASHFTGIPQSTLGGMLPVVTSLAVGGAATALHSQGMGGLLGQFDAGKGNSGAGGFTGMMGNIFNSFLGGGGATSAGAAGPAAGGLPPMVQAGMDSLFKMFQSGVPGQGRQPSDSGHGPGASPKR